MLWWIACVAAESPTPPLAPVAPPPAPAAPKLDSAEALAAALTAAGWTPTCHTVDRGDVTEHRCEASGEGRWAQVKKRGDEPVVVHVEDSASAAALVDAVLVEPLPRSIREDFAARILSALPATGWTAEDCPWEPMSDLAGWGCVLERGTQRAQLTLDVREDQDVAQVRTCGWGCEHHTPFWTLSISVPDPTAAAALRDTLSVP